MNPLRNKMFYRWAVLTEKGQTRSENQDNYLADPERSLFIVSDGIGGHQGGSLASKVVVSVLPKMIERGFKKLKSTRGRTIHCMLRDSIVQLGQQLLAGTENQAILKGMGATLVMAQLWNRRAFIAHIGDSRAYLFRQSNLTQITEDHSVVGILLRSGEISPKQAKTHPARGQLSRYIGMKHEAYPDVQSIGLKKADRLLLCSDGLTGMLNNNAISKILKKHYDPQNTCKELVNAAQIAGGDDDITNILIDFV